ncbi:hypothetical protein RQ658_11650, partial [Streptococcus pneumoniae]|nr:hypothetical protein [Streptococcus pneumoniae]
KKHPLGEKRNHPGSKLRQGFWMVFRLGVNNWGYILFVNERFEMIELKKPTTELIFVVSVCRLNCYFHFKF